MILIDNFLEILFEKVGGHTRLLLLNQSTVIKPLNLRELDFYQNIPQDIQKFVPKYKGECFYFIIFLCYNFGRSDGLEVILR